MRMQEKKTFYIPGNDHSESLEQCPWDRVRKGAGCLFTLARIPIILAQKEVLQIVVALMTEVGKNTSKPVRMLCGIKVSGKSNKSRSCWDRT